MRWRERLRHDTGVLLTVRHDVRRPLPREGLRGRVRALQQLFSSTGIGRSGRCSISAAEPATIALAWPRWATTSSVSSAPRTMLEIAREDGGPAERSNCTRRTSEASISVDESTQSCSCSLFSAISPRTRTSWRRSRLRAGTSGRAAAGVRCLVRPGGLPAAALRAVLAHPPRAGRALAGSDPATRSAPSALSGALRALARRGGSDFDQAEEEHVIRFFFANELRLLLSRSGFSLVRLSAFPE